MGIFSQENIRKSIKKTILSIYCPLRNIALKAKWQFEYISLKNKKNGKGTTPKNISECSFSHVLYIVPHADDELISGWSYQKRNNHNTTLYYCGFTGSNSFEENIKTRRNEIKKYADCMALMLIEKKDDIKKEILNLVLKEKTDAIFLPCYIDWHHEHRLINDILEGLTSLSVKRGFHY